MALVGLVCPAATQEEGDETMLILTRRGGESLKIGDEVTITVLGIRGSEVRIGVAAPRAIPVHREEVYARIQAEKLSMAANEPQTPDTGDIDVGSI